MYCDNSKAIIKKRGVSQMREKNVVFFTDREEEFATLLIKIGTRKNIAKALVFLANTKETTSHAIERGTDMRQPEVSLAMRYLSEQGWIRSRDSEPENKGRPMKIYELAKPLHEIMDCIEKEKVTEANNQLALVRKLRDHMS
jgi:predicted transcriptional regulator